jgi:hypothetical protein
LQDAFAALETKKERFVGEIPIQIAPGFEGAIKAHDAGYDAYCTGTLFLKACHLLRVQDLTKVFSDPLLDMYKNRIAVAGRKMPLKLDADSLHETREDVFVLEKSSIVTSPESMKSMLEQRYGKVALYKVYWSDTLLYVVPSSLASRTTLMNDVSTPVTFEIEGTVATLSKYDDFVKAQGWR